MNWKKMNYCWRLKNYRLKTNIYKSKTNYKKDNYFYCGEKFTINLKIIHKIFRPWIQKILMISLNQMNQAILKTKLNNKKMTLI